MIKRSYQLTYNISNEELNNAVQLNTYIDYSLKLLSATGEFLNTIKVPFEKNKEMSSEEILGQRYFLREFRDNAVQKFEDFKASAFHVVNNLNMFSSDPQILSMTKAFVNSVSNLEKDYNKFALLFNNMESGTFIADIIKNCKELQNKLNDLSDILDERIKNYVSSNIIGQTWVDKMYSQLGVEKQQKKKNYKVKG